MQSISVVGLGFIGLPLAISFCEKGFRVYGIEVDTAKLDWLKRGVSYVQEDDQGIPLDKYLQKHLQQETFIPTDRMEEAAKAVDTYVVTVGVPVSGTGDMVYDYLDSAMQNIGSVLKKGDFILLRPTVVPGMIEERLIPQLERVSGLKAGADFHVAYAAERVAEGRAMEEFRTLDVVAGGLTPACTERAVQLLQQLTSGTVHVTDLRTAQLAKVVENVQRDVNLAIINELRQVAEAHHVDIYELIRMTNTHPRVQLLMPSVGVGGFCIPNAYYYLRASVDNPHMMPLYDTARRVNSDVPNQLVKDAATALAASGRSLQGAPVAILGLGMKDGSNDTRLSPPVDLAKVFISSGAHVRAYDPTIAKHSFPFQVESPEVCLDGAQVLVVGAWQPPFEALPWRQLLEKTNRPYIIDPRHRLKGYLS
ncbi:nucleotide sugar dehydrogenase [Alicyclobacillus sp. TC]|uniref:nucleotide sugar dehydrogenase n=1 Tax=Alicyclobacillus sp. TC TaxID=2606450 RepID=UPI0019344133|nr:nucleotide sugar dehydrogenase [Alicyclobacillus sp. TC]QRF24265.1 nucleotide sugar dehydrogenase [Alicyclobacillus sp. TC]